MIGEIMSLYSFVQLRPILAFYIFSFKEEEEECLAEAEAAELDSVFLFFAKPNSPILG